MKIKGSVISLVVIFAAAMISGCGSSPTTPTTATPSGSVPIAGELAELGQTVFSSICAGCHGSSGGGGTGPAIIGSRAALSKYGTAQGLFDYVSTNMPAFNPGSLSHAQYVNVVSFLLLENDYVTAGTRLDENQLGSISLQ